MLRQWAAEVADGHEDVSLQSWLVDFDRADGRVRDRGEFLTGVAERLGWSDSVDVLLDRWPQMFGARYRIDDSLRAAFRRARHAGCRLAVVSNGTSDSQRAKIDAMGLPDEVDACLISGEVGIRKPDARIFALAAEAAGAALDDAWMIGDDPDADISGGWGVGARPIWVNRSGAAWPTKVREPYWQCGDPVTAIEYALAHP